MEIKTLEVIAILITILMVVIALFIAMSIVHDVKEMLVDGNPMAELLEKIIEQNEEIKQQNIDLDNIIEELEHIKQELEKWEIIDLEVTAYAPLDNKSGICTDGNPNVTATGTSPSHGTVAVNPDVIPYGTRMYIPSYGWGVAADTGSALRSMDNVIDIYKKSHHDAVKWGRRTLPILIERND